MARTGERPTRPKRARWRNSLHADLAQPRARVLLQERLKAAGKAGGRAREARARRRCRRHGRRHRAWCALRGSPSRCRIAASSTSRPPSSGRASSSRSAIRTRRSATRRWPDCRADVEGHGVAKADVVIEAIFEDLNAKRELYARIEPQLKPLAVLATNTSSIVLEQLAQNWPRPSGSIGLHFFNPVARMPLVEVIRRAHAPSNVRRGLAFARRSTSCHRLSQLAGFPRQPRADAVPERSDARGGGRHSARADRSRGRGVRHADGPDRARRRRRPRRRA